MGFPDFFHEGLKFVKAEPHYHEKVGNLHHWRVYFAVQNADSQLLADDYVYIDLHRNNPETLMGCEYCTLPIIASEFLESIFELTEKQINSLIYRRGIGDSLVPMLPTAEGEVQVTELGVKEDDPIELENWIGIWVYDLDGNYLGWQPDEQNSIIYIEKEIGLASSPQYYNEYQKYKQKNKKKHPCACYLKEKAVAIITAQTFKELKETFDNYYADTKNGSSEMGGMLCTKLDSNELTHIVFQGVQTAPTSDGGLTFNIDEDGIISIIDSYNKEMKDCVFCFWHSHPPRIGLEHFPSGQSNDNTQFHDSDVGVSFAAVQSVAVNYRPRIKLLLTYERITLYQSDWREKNLISNWEYAAPIFSLKREKIPDFILGATMLDSEEEALIYNWFQIGEAFFSTR